MNRAVVFLLLPWLVGCSHEESIEWQQMRRTVLVYLAGDNSLFVGGGGEAYSVGSGVEVGDRRSVAYLYRPEGKCSCAGNK